MSHSSRALVLTGYKALLFWKGRGLC
ncbi:rCG52298 [Rattus norvegicus]|uniref:RCG52298 n=1 Tax=Rattus norvegicus TaxID=10116 RepID=A6K0J8_RAT|nr:rCG52298 [Rattus norvegicus]